MSNKIRPEHSSGLQVPQYKNSRQQQNHTEFNTDQEANLETGQAQARAPIFSISRLTQMARTRTVDQVSPVRGDVAGHAHDQNNQDNNNNQQANRRSSRLKSQSSILSFVSTQNQKPRPIIDSEGDKFLRRFATNNNRANPETDIPSNDDVTNIRKLCLNLLSGNFVIDPARRFHYRWLQLISLAVSYNIIFIIGRATFWNLHNYCPRVWYTLDYICDFIYLLDMVAQSRTGYLEQGLLVRKSSKLAQHYLKSYAFKLDLISVIPTDLAYLSMASRCQTNRVPCSVIVRLNRLFRFHRLAHYFERTESATNFPFVFRISKLVFYILVIIHWNACVYFALSYAIGFGSDRWVYQPAVPINTQPSQVVIGSLAQASPAQAPDSQSNDIKTSGNLSESDKLPAIGGNNNNTNTTSANVYDDFHMMNDPLVHQYIYCFYWSTLTLTTIGEVPMPERDEEYLFVVIDLLLGMLIFATIVGNIGSMITSMNAARAEFQHKMDSVKQWMKFRKVNKELEERIIKWFDYLWANRQTLDEDAVTAILPDRLKAETAIHVHLETLKRVQLFQDCEPGLLVQLVLKLKLQVFSPGDFICRVGDVGKEMYIVKRGELNVLSEDCAQVYGKLTDGSVFGELSILNISGVKTGNRRTANVRSVGYSDLFALSKQDLWQVLEDYPDAKTMLIDRGKEILRKDGLLVEDADSKRSDVSMSAAATKLQSGPPESKPNNSKDLLLDTESLKNSANNCSSRNSDADNSNALHLNIMTNDGSPATLNKMATSISTSIMSGVGAAPWPSPSAFQNMLATDGRHQGPKVDAFRTPSLFGLSGDSTQLDQLMMNFQQQHLQQQQQQQQHILKSFPFQRQVSQQISARSSIIRKRQSLHAVFEGSSCQQSRFESNNAMNTSTTTTTATATTTPFTGDGNGLNRQLEVAGSDSSEPTLTKSLNDAPKSSSFHTPKTIEKSELRKQGTIKKVRCPKMKKSLSFALPGEINIINYARNYGICNDKVANCDANANELSSTEVGRMSANDNNGISNSPPARKFVPNYDGNLGRERTNSFSNPSLDRRSCINDILDPIVMQSLNQGGQAEQIVRDVNEVMQLDNCGIIAIAGLASQLVKTLDKLCHETSQTQASIKDSLDKFERILTSASQSQTDSPFKDTSTANELKYNGKQLNPTTTDSFSNKNVNNSISATPDGNEENSIAALANKIPTRLPHLPERPATANSILVSTGGQSRSKSKLARTINLQDFEGQSKHSKTRMSRQKKLDYCHKTSASKQSQSDGCLAIDD